MMCNRSQIGPLSPIAPIWALACVTKLVNCVTQGANRLNLAEIHAGNRRYWAAPSPSNLRGAVVEAVGSVASSPDRGQ